jgi:hypothetical protein
VPSTAILPPVTFSQLQAAGLGLDYVFAAQEILLGIQDSLDLESMGVASMWGFVDGTGSDVLRVTHVDDIGWSRRFADLATEDSSIAASGFTAGYTDVTVGMVGLAEEETYNSQILTREGSLTLDQLARYIPMSLAATVRYKACIVGAAIAGTVGSTTTTLSVADWIALGVVYTEAVGSMAQGLPKATLSPQQFTQLQDSAMAHPAFQNAAGDFATIARIQGQNVANYLGLNMDIGLTDDVQQSGGAYQGFSVQVNGIGIGRARTNRISPANSAGAFYVPAAGLFIEPIGKGSTGSKRHEARAWLGLAEGSPIVYTNRRILSVV